MKRLTGAILFPFCFFVLLFFEGCVSGSQKGDAAVSGEILNETDGMIPTEGSSHTEEIDASSKEAVREIIWLSGSEEPLDMEQRSLIQDYRRRYYESLTDFRPREIGDLFSKDAGAWIALHENTWEYLIGLREMQRTDLRLTGYRSEMTVDQIEEAEDGLRIIITEKSTQNFAQHPDVDSELYGIIHTFKLIMEDGTWRIREHQQRDGIYWNMQREYWGDEIQSLEDPESYFSGRKELLLQTVREELEGRSDEQYQGEARNPEPDVPYDREAAVDYGSLWVGLRNEEWSDFTGRGGNCQNFVSQCLLAGGIPMDIEGSEIWKWYSEGVNEEPVERGNSLSWINVDSFYAYARDNRGFGLVAETDANFRSGRPGDVIIMGSREDWNHTVMISQVISDMQGRTIDYLILSNTSDVKNFPASAYPSPCQELIRIFGWNR